ncbi:MAG: hypothetical protein OZSIB_4203 [Candidatus Ozemobacter sibiricus]|jgi:hypothetical protein|uniref:Uncharacterized protein n=1 Tax=Candidatus Ozemobacter sibiricus TaxID=2268124 RepID=A0A367ZQV9_9BACT|nr:MAG: hypothetical protein OZSIB_4203 [Candidatus Ozemobacter sibiricus]
MPRLAWLATLCFTIVLSLSHPLIPRSLHQHGAYDTALGWRIALSFLIIARSLIGIIFPEDHCRASAAYAIAAFLVPPVLMAVITMVAT